MSQNESFDPQVILLHVFCQSSGWGNALWYHFKSIPLLMALGLYYRLSESLHPGPLHHHPVRAQGSILNWLQAQVSLWKVWYQLQPQGGKSNIKKGRQKAFLKVIWPFSRVEFMFLFLRFEISDQFNTSCAGTQHNNLDCLIWIEMGQASNSASIEVQVCALHCQVPEGGD